MRSFTLLLLALLCAAPAYPAEKPNIVFFLADDLGWTGLGSFGSDFYETPNLDRLAGKGVKFTNAYAACTVCSPTRASLMGGMYPARIRLTDFIPGQHRPYAKMTIPDWNKGLDGDLTTMAEALKTGGYRTIHIGKWHLDFPGESEQGPLAHGFDATHDKPRGTNGYFIPEQTVKKLGLGSNYSTDYLTDKAVEEIEKSRDGPFFLYFAYHVPHTPIQGRADLVGYFQSKVNPASVHKNPTYAAMVKSMDMSVGRVLECLEKRGLAGNTLTVFISDNGGLTQRYGKHDEFTENLPLRRGKGSAYEGGVRVPAIAYWPGVAPGGVVSDTPIMTIDFYPTFLEATGVGGNATHNGNLDGKSLVPLLKDPRQTIDRDLFWHYPHYHAGGDGPYSAIRSGDWRLIEFHEDGALELYHLSKDLAETNNLAGARPQVRDNLKAKLHQWRRSIDAQMPVKNPRYDPARAMELAKRGR